MNQKTNIEEIEKTDMAEQVFMPTHQDLINAVKYGLPIFTSSKTAVYVKKISEKHRAIVTTKGNIPIEKGYIKSLHTQYKYDFLVDFQYKEDMELKDSELEFMEAIQQVPELKAVCMNEQSSYQTAPQFEQQLKSWKSRNSNRELVPVSEVQTTDMIGKTAIAKKHGIKRYAIKFRSYGRYEAELAKFLQVLERSGLYSIVLGVMPTKNKKNVTMLLPPLKRGAKATARWIAWGGREVPMRVVCEDWKYNLLKDATAGATNYSGLNRLQLIRTRNNIQFNTAFEKIDTINQVTAMIPRLKSMTEVQFKSLF